MVVFYLIDKNVDETLFVDTRTLETKSHLCIYLLFHDARCTMARIPANGIFGKVENNFNNNRRLLQTECLFILLMRS